MTRSWSHTKAKHRELAASFSKRTLVRFRTVAASLARNTEDAVAALNRLASPRFRERPQDVTPGAVSFSINFVEQREGNGRRTEMIVAKL